MPPAEDEEVEDESDEEERESQRRAQVGDRVDERAKGHGLIVVPVLEGVARLVGGDAQGGDGVALKDPLRQAQDTAPGVVIVGQLARDLLDFDVARASRLEELVGRLGPRDPGCGVDLTVFSVGTLDP